MGRNIREELLRRPADRKNIREIKLQENGLLARLALQRGDRLARLLSAARCEVNLRVACQELLRVLSVGIYVQHGGRLL